MKFFKKIFLETGYDAFDTLNKGIIIAFYILPMLLLETVPELGVACLIIFPLILIIRNLKLKKISYMILFFIIQLIWGIPLFVLWIYRLMENVKGNSNVKYVSRKVDTEMSWYGNRSENNERAKQFGYNSVADAIAHGCDYYGNKIF